MIFDCGTWTEWHASTSKPDADLTVMIFALKGADPVTEGAWDGAKWITPDGSIIRDVVMMWAEMPYPEPIEKARAKAAKAAKKNKAMECSAEELKTDSAAIHSPAINSEAA